MHLGQYVFSQLVELLPQKAFQRIVMKYQGDKYIKYFTCWNQLLVMMFGQLSNCDSLRELVSIITAHSVKSYHLGFGKSVITRSNLAKAYASRNNKIFEEFAYKMISIAQSKRITRDFEILGRFYAFEYKAQDLVKGRRMIVVRQKIAKHPKVVVKQLSLFEDDYERNSYRCACYITTLKLSVVDIWRLYRGRTNCENRIK